jgi:uncharacterized repeat protein (TIGR04138 family)
MLSDHFARTVEEIVERDSRFDREAYQFVRDALLFTARQQRRRLGKSPAPAECHVTGQQLLDGARRYALDQYGPMVPAVFEHWGIKSCQDIGAIVFNLIGAGEFGKTEQDTIADFQDGFDFHEAFVLPFRPAKPIVPVAPTKPLPARPRRSRASARKAA